MEPIVVAGLLGRANFILEGEDHVLGVRDGERAHGTSEVLCTRNYG